MKRLIAAASMWLAGAAMAATLSPIQLLNPAGSTAGQAIVSTGASSAPAWGAVSAGALAPIAANTVLGNFAASSAPPAAFAVPSCSTANSALKYASGTGLSCGATFALTSGDLSQFASTTSAQLAGVISNETGSGALVFGTSPTLTTPTIASIVNTGTLTLPSSTDTIVGRATTDTLTNKTLTTPTLNGATFSGTFAGSHSYSGAVSFTSTITPSQTAGIVGTTTNNNANAGSVGEYLAATSGSVSISNGVNTDVISVALTAGDWDVQGVINYVPAGGTTTGPMLQSIGTSSGAFGPTGATTQYNYNVAAGANQTHTTPVVRVSLASSGAAYLVTNTGFSGGTLNAIGFIRARRVR